MIMEENNKMFSEQENKDIWDFYLNHQCKKTKKLGPKIIVKLLGGNGIGTGVVVKCKHCKKEKNVTDYDSW